MMKARTTTIPIMRANEDNSNTIAPGQAHHARIVSYPSGHACPPGMAGSRTFQVLEPAISGVIFLCRLMKDVLLNPETVTKTMIIIEMRVYTDAT